jgi:hypothetical protein
MWSRQHCGARLFRPWNVPLWGLGKNPQDQNEVGGAECPRDFPRPFLPRQKVFFIHPWFESTYCPKVVIDRADLGFILAGMAEENPRHNTFS